MSRAFQTRLDEHIKAWWNNSLGISTFADYLTTENHFFSDEHSKLLDIEPDYRKWIAYEESEIIHHMKKEHPYVPNKVIPEDGFLLKLYNMRESPS
mgnify:CR=1 FL=1